MGVIIIGLSGAARSGKTTVGDALKSHIRNKLGSAAECFAFADPIREVAKSLFMFEDYEVWKDQVIDPDFGVGGGITGREFMEQFGTEFVRQRLGSQFWVRHLAKRISRHEKAYESCCLGNTFAIVTDVRFENEAQFIRENGGIVVRVESWQKEITLDPSGHVSRRPLPDHLVDFAYQNIHRAAQDGVAEDVKTGLLDRLEFKTSVTLRR